jgi:hypothetical protein
MRSRLLAPVLVLITAALGVAVAIADPDPKPAQPTEPPQSPGRQPGGGGGGGDDSMRGPRQPGDPSQPGRGPGGPGGRGGGGQGVGGSMKTMNRDLKAMRSMLNDPAKKDECLRTIAEMERACITAKTSPIPQPVLGKAKDDAERATITAKYRTDLIAVMRRLLDTEEHIVADKTDLARADLDELLKLKDQGHKDVGIDDDGK